MKVLGVLLVAVMVPPWEFSGDEMLSNTSAADAVALASVNAAANRP